MAQKREALELKVCLCRRTPTEYQRQFIASQNLKLLYFKAVLAAQLGFVKCFRSRFAIVSLS